MSIAKDLVLVTFLAAITILFLLTANDITLFTLIVIIESYILFQYFNIKKELESEREYFIKTLSHDLRVSTIAQIRGLELLEKYYDKDLVNEINGSCKYTLDMITMLLNNYRYKNGEQVLKYEKFNLVESIIKSFNNLNNLAKDKNIEFSYKIPSLCEIEADKECLEKVIKTLIMTSIFYGKENSTISLNIKRESDNIGINIIYKGKSLTDEECRRMFSKNPRFSTVGHGIKMHFCKNIIEFHGGTIRVRNLSQGLNSFSFVIPLYKKEIELKPTVLLDLQPYNS